MPSLRTRLQYQAITVSTAQVALGSASQAVAQAAGQLSDLATGDFDLDAITIGGVRYITEGGELVPAI